MLTSQVSFRSRRFQTLSAGALAAAAIVLATSPCAHAIRFGTNIADAEHPSVGILKVSNDSDNGYGTGVIIENNILPKRSFVLTATHNFYDFNVTTTTLYPKGKSGTAVTASAWGLHPGYSGETGLAETNDVAVVRFDTEIAGITPSALYRDAVAEGDTLTAVGFGQPQDTSNFPNNIQKRKGDFRVDALNATKVESRSPNPNPPPDGFQRLPVIGKGDSGGPWFKGTANKVAAVTNSVDTDFNRDPTRSYATLVKPYLDFIDSFTQRAVFWDNLRFTTQAAMFRNESLPDPDLFSGTFTGGIAAGWQATAVSNYPNPGGGNVDVPLNTDARPFQAIGHNNGDVPEDTLAKSQGMFPTGATPYIIKKSFNVEVDNERPFLTIAIDQMWNSLMLGARLGIKIDAGAIDWQDYQISAADNLNTWMTRSKEYAPGAGAHTVEIYLLTNVPSPAPITLLAFCCPIAMARRRR